MTQAGAWTIKAMLAPLLRHPRAAQVIKWTVYSLLVINWCIYFVDDYQAFHAAVADDAPWGEWLEAFSTTGDAMAWLGLVFILEFETYILEDDAYTGWVARSLLLLKALCYLVILSACYGYFTNTFGNYDVAEISGLTDLCSIAGTGQWLQINIIDFVEITAENCAVISAGPPFYTIDINTSIIDRPTLEHVQILGWPDIVNSVTWLFIIALVETEVWLQSQDRFGSRLLRAARRIKTCLYGLLFVNITIWIFSGYPLYAYDSLVWIVGFWAIELNLAEWEQDRLQELAGETQAA